MDADSPWARYLAYRREVTALGSTPLPFMPWKWHIDDAVGDAE